MKKILDLLFSTRLTGMLFVIFFIAIGAATFIEEAYDTVTAKILVYDAFWLELVMLFMMINFIGNIARYRLFRWEKIGTLTFHFHPLHNLCTRGTRILPGPVFNITRAPV